MASVRSLHGSAPPVTSLDVGFIIQAVFPNYAVFTSALLFRYLFLILWVRPHLTPEPITWWWPSPARSILLLVSQKKDPYGSIVEAGIIANNVDSPIRCCPNARVKALKP